jgi:PilZ domain
MLSLISTLTRDRRSAHRHNLKIPLRYRVGRHSSSQHVSESANVSALGISFTSDQELRVGSIVDLWIEMPTEINGTSVSHWLCTGHVVRVGACEPSSPLRMISVQFDCYEVLDPAHKHLGAHVVETAT